jgi:hypothetical protein
MKRKGRRAMIVLGSYKGLFSHCREGEKLSSILDTRHNENHKQRLSQCALSKGTISVEGK